MHLPVGSRMIFFYRTYLKLFLFPFFYFYDVFNYLLLIISDKEIKIVQLSPSLIFVPLLRDFLFLFIAKVFNKKTIVFFRGWKQDYYNSIKSNAFKRFIFNNTYGKADSILVLSDSFKKNLITLGWNKLKIQTTTTAVNKKDIIESKDRLNKNKIRFIYVGRISHLKGIVEMLDAFKSVNSQIYDLELIIVGHPDSKINIDKLKKTASDDSISCKIKFLGHVDGPSKFNLLSKSDVFIFPSYTEGCPNSVLEALSSGLFILSTKVGALSEIIKNKKNGIFVKKEDSNDLKIKIDWTIKNINFIRMQKDKIKNNSINKFDINTIIKKFDIIYSSLVKN